MGPTAKASSRRAASKQNLKSESGPSILSKRQKGSTAPQKSGNSRVSINMQPAATRQSLKGAAAGEDSTQLWLSEHEGLSVKEGEQLPAGPVGGDGDLASG